MLKIKFFDLKKNLMTYLIRKFENDKNIKIKFLFEKQKSMK